MKFSKFGLLLIINSILFMSCHDEDKKETSTEPAYKEESVSYNLDSVTMNGFVVYDSNNSAKRPVVLVVPEWWGLNEYTKTRARDLAKLGYIAMAVDMYGNGAQADDPKSATSLSGPFYTNPQMAKARFDAALAKIKTYSQADSAKVAAVGYCFGGGMLLNFARMGEDINGVVSFHGSLLGTPADKNLLKAKILVCHGGADPFVPKADADAFKKQMDSIGATYTFKEYEGAMHAFTNPNATALGEKFKIPIKYNAAADTASWKDMKEFLNTVFK